MPSASTSQFPGVAVSIQSKIHGTEAEEDWEEYDWVKWSVGDISVDSDSFIIVFKTADKGVKAKSLGNLLRASMVEDEEGRDVRVTTSDALHRLYRFTFQSREHAGEFLRLAERAAPLQPAAASQEARTGTSPTNSPSNTLFTAAIEEHLRDRCPLVYSGAELYGPDPGSGSEVLLDRGAVVLLDPAEQSASGGRVGAYELLFYGEEGAAAPLQPRRFQISPKMSLKRQAVDQQDEDSPAASFVLTGINVRAPAEMHSITFDENTIASAFARDFQVRLRVMQLSFKTVKGQRSAEEAYGQLEEFKRRTLCARLCRCTWILLVLLVMAACGRLAMLWSEDRTSPHPFSPKYVAALADDARLAMTVSTRGAAYIGSKACALATGAVPAAEVMQCVALGRLTEVRQCVETLTGHSPA